MRLEQFNIGDLVRYMPGDGPAGIHSEILFIGKQYVFLRNFHGDEFIREREAEDFELWLSYGELLTENKLLRKLGDNLVSSIENAAWKDSKGRDNLSGPTWHMGDAVAYWKQANQRKQ